MKTLTLSLMVTALVVVIAAQQEPKVKPGQAQAAPKRTGPEKPAASAQKQEIAELEDDRDADDAALDAEEAARDAEQAARDEEQAARDEEQAARDEEQAARDEEQ